MLANDDIMKKIADEGGVGVLIDVVRCGSDAAKEKALAALQKLGLGDDIKNAIAKDGGVTVLMDIVKTGSEKAKTSATDALLRGLETGNEMTKTKLLRRGVWEC